MENQVKLRLLVGSWITGPKEPKLQQHSQYTEFYCGTNRFGLWPLSGSTSAHKLKLIAFMTVFLYSAAALNLLEF